MTGIYLEKSLKSPVKVIYGFLFVMLMISGIWLGRSIGLSLSRLDVADEQLVETSRSPVRTGQKNLLIIGVDDFISPEIHLRSVWLGIYFPGELDLTFIPLYPATRNGIPFYDPELEKSFALDDSGKLSPTFIEKLGDVVWWDNYLVIDEFLLVNGIVLLGGISMSEKHLDGRSVIDSIPEVDVDAHSALQSQVELIGAICAGIRRGAALERIESQLIRLIDHYRSDLDLSDFLKEWRFFRPNQSKSLSCEFPTLDFISP